MSNEYHALRTNICLLRSVLVLGYIHHIKVRVHVSSGRNIYVQLKSRVVQRKENHMYIVSEQNERLHGRPIQSIQIRRTGLLRHAVYHFVAHI